MIHDRGIKSFSLVEMLVVMVLASVVVSLIYWVYYSVSSYNLLLKSKLAKAETREILFHVLKKDFMTGVEVRRVDHFVIVCKYPRGMTAVRYSFNKEFIVRDQLTRKDTFDFNVLHAVFLRNQSQVDYRNSLIDEIEILLSDSTDITLYREYDRATLIEALSDSTKWEE